MCRMALEYVKKKEGCQMKKGLLISILFILVLICLPKNIVKAETCGDLTYVVENDEIIITDCSESAISVNIPSEIGGLPVTSIGNSAFYNCNSLIDIIVPNSVKSIESGAFKGCSSLEEMTLPFVGTMRGNNGTSGSVFGAIFGYTSYWSSDLVTQYYNKSYAQGYAYYYIPNSIKKVTITDESIIGYGAFYGCTNINDVILLDGVTSINNYAFENSGIPNIVIPNSVTYIGNLAFHNCGFSNIDIPDNVTTIGNGAFKSCSFLESISIPESVTSIGEGAFEECSSLEEITLPFIGSQRGNSGTVDSVFGYVFGYETLSSDADENDIKQYYASSSYAYYHIPVSLKKVTVTDETFVGYGAFYGCTNISDIIIESDVKAVGSRAFAYHYNLLNVTIKSNSPKFADSMVFYDTDFATLYGYEGSTVEEYATKNGIDFESLVLLGHCEIDGSIKAIKSTLVVNVDINAIVTDECLHIALYTDNGQMVDYIIVPSDKPFNAMNVVFKDNKDSSYAKVFLWNGFTSLQPLTEAKRIDIVR